MAGGASFNHVGQCVSDLERSTRFYTEAFGFEVARELQVPDAGAAPLLRLEPPVGLTSVYLKRDAFVLELIHFADKELVPAEERVVNQLGLTHISLSVDSIPEACAAVEAAGGEVLQDTNVGVAVFVRDPDGQLLELLTGWDKP